MRFDKTVCILKRYEKKIMKIHGNLRPDFEIRRRFGFFGNGAVFQRKHADNEGNPGMAIKE